MNRSTILWIIAIVFTLVVGVYQRMTGPTYPQKGHVVLGGKELRYSLDRSHGGEGGHIIRIDVQDPGTTGIMQWRRFKTADPWTSVPMSLDGKTLSAELPHQPPAGKLAYRITLSAGDQTALLPEEGGVVLRFKGEVPTWVIILHVIVIFGAMVLSTRTGLEYFNTTPRLSVLSWWTVVFLAVGGMILGPIVQKYAFDAFWTGWPFGHDLTDNKTLAALIAWGIAAVTIRRARNPRNWVLGAAIVTLIVFLIPHSVLGSELDYSTMAQPQSGAPSSQVP
jgi:hypothetical protein